MPETSIPVFCNERIAVSRPEPGLHEDVDLAHAVLHGSPRARASAASWAANGVDFREPLKPTFPADAHARTLPSRSVMETIVLLNELLMWATP